MVQMNSTVGDLDGNVRSIIRWIKEARKMQPDVLAFPELAITGYPPEDLVLRPSFLKDTRKGLARIAKACRGITAVIGFLEEGEVLPANTPPALIVPSGRRAIHNAAAIIADTRHVWTYRKMLLPNYGVFDESRYFCPGNTSAVYVVNGVTMGVTICEDIWYPSGPARDQVLVGGAEVIININASPYQIGKRMQREEMLAARAREMTAIVSYTNIIGGQDELVFDGNSLIVDHAGMVLGRGKAFQEDMLIMDLDVDVVGKARSAQTKSPRGTGPITGKVKHIVISKRQPPRKRAGVVHRVEHPLQPLEEVYQALVTGVRDYVCKNRFRKVLIGISGGIDSALTAVIAADALGATSVQGVFMASPFTSRESREDVMELMDNLKAPLLQIPITALMNAYLKTLRSFFSGTQPDSTEENIQARIRGNLLMALSNKFGHLVLTTGNKSEMSVGYATLYGDMAGGFAVIKDVSKTLVYELAKYRNAHARATTGCTLIPDRMITRPPSAELRPNQTDQDSLPPYEVLDPLLKAYVEEDCSLEDMVNMGYARSVVKKVIRMVDQSEYKRRQAPVGIKITPRALGKDRRMPITNRYAKV